MQSGYVLVVDKDGPSRDCWRADMPGLINMQGVLRRNGGPRFPRFSAYFFVVVVFFAAGAAATNCKSASTARSELAVTSIVRVHGV